MLEIVIDLPSCRKNSGTVTLGTTSKRMPTQPSKLSTRSGRISSKEIVSNARNVVKIFEQLNLPSALPHPHLSNLQLHHVFGPSLGVEETTWMMHSLERSLKHLYDSSAMNWDKHEKLSDLTHPHQRILIVSDKESGERLAFLSYRWEVEEDEPIMYVYELFVEARARGKQLGIALMTYAEGLCRKQHVYKLVLTVFCENQAAMRLYTKKLGYNVDDDSPSKCGIEDVGYEILSRRLPEDSAS